jgi:glycerol-1-phosphate dehydrogenase [NAD(P)+]
MTTASERSGAEAARDLEGLRQALAGAPEAERLQPLGLGAVMLGEDLLERVGEIAVELRRDGGEVALLMDRRPMAAPGGEVKEIVAGAIAAAGAEVRSVLIGGPDAHVHADAPTLDGALQAVSGASLLVSVGSGTISDIGKYTSARLGGLPHVIVQTAASVNGFGDDQSVLVIKGVKRTTPSRWADRLVIDTGVLGLAPAEMNRAGLGDLLATYTAPADWLLARLVGQDESFSPAAVALCRDHVDPALDAAEGVSAGSPAAMEALAAALTLSGISMGVAGKTAPGSGMEHTVSHLIEMTEESETLHGAKVGVLTVFAALLWERVREAVREGALVRLSFPEAASMQRVVSEAFDAFDPSGAMAAECWQDYERKLARWNANRAALLALPERWPAFEQEVDRLLGPPEMLLAALQRAGAPTRLTDLGIDPQRAHWALSSCHLMRDRFTIADLAFFLGMWTTEDVDAVIEKATSLGGGL